MHQSLFKKKSHVLLITLLTLNAFMLLFILRNADDNRLTSWQWVFADVELTWFIPLIALGIIITYALLSSPVSRQRPLLFLFLISFAVGTIFWKIPEVIVDTSRYFTQAKHLEIYGIKYFISGWGKNINAWTDLPLVPFLYGLIFKFFGETRAFIQVFTTLAFSLTVVFTYLIGKTLGDEETGFFAGTLLLGIPYIFSQTPLMLVDVPTMFFLTLSIYTFIMAMEKGGAWPAFSSIAIFCTLFSKYSTWIMLSVLPVIFLVHLKNPGGRHNKAVIFRCVLAALIAAVFTGIIFIFKSEVILRQIDFLREYQAPGLRRWGESFVSTFLFQVHPFITIAAIYSVYEAFRKKDLKFLIIFWLLFLIVLFQVRRSRYVMVIFPMLALMASYGLQKIKTPEIRRYIASCIVGVSLVVAIFAYLPFLQRMSLVNCKDAGRFLDSVHAEKIEVFTIPSAKSAVNPSIAVPILDLFTDADILYRQDKEFSLPFEKIEKSPLRFTWEYKNPAYYIKDDKDSGKDAIVIISNRTNKLLPNRIKRKIKGYKKTGVFNTSTGIFRYSPVVTIYMPQ